MLGEIVTEVGASIAKVLFLLDLGSLSLFPRKDSVFREEVKSHFNLDNRYI